MSIRDTDITDWSTVSAENAPTDGTYIGGDLAGQFRNIKSVARSESLEKEFIKTGYITAGATAGTPAQISFYSSEGDLTGTFTDRRKVRLRPSDGSDDWVYCAVVASSYISSTTVTLVNLSGTVASSTEYFVDVGVDYPTKCPLPLWTQSGTVAFVNTNTSVTASFTHSEPDTDYFPKLTVISSDSTNAGATVVSDISKSRTGLSLTTNQEPGASKTVVFGWTIMRES